MRQKRTKYEEYDRFCARKYRGPSPSAATKFGKYISKLDVVTNLYIINDIESKTTYKLRLAERRAFGDVHKEFENIHQWYESLDKEVQDRIIRIPLEDKMNEIKEE